MLHSLSKLRCHCCCHTVVAAAAAAGVAFFYGGMVQSKNVVSTIMQAFVPLAIIPVVWSIVG
jgi:Amt family ammonium transporter